MHLFYTPDIESDYYQLSEEESKHCVRVLRLGVADTVFLIDGRGGFYETEIIDAHPKRTMLKVVNVQREQGKRSFFLHIAIAPTKNMDRLEWFLEKATEIGVDEITPIICQRSERKDVKLDRLQKIIISAMKQSIKAYQPILNEAVDFKSFIKSSSAVPCKLMAHCVPTGRKSLKKAFDPQKELRVLMLIGPEGDFSQEEIDVSIDAGFVPVTLGESRLRTETAGVYACAALNLLHES